MRTALFVTVDAGGNLPPALGIARELARRGLRVVFLGHPAQQRTVQANGFEFEPFRRGRQFDPSAETGTIQGLQELTALFADPGIAADARAAAVRLRADVVVVDCLQTGTLAARIGDTIPTVSLVHTFWGYFEQMARGPVGAILRLRRVRMMAAMRSPALSLVTARREFDPAGGLPPAVAHVGVVWQGEPVPAVPADRPRVLVSLSTTSFPGQQRRLQRIVDALGALPVDGVVTTGPAIDPATLRAPANVAVHRWLDHGEVLPSASLVIGHGGHSTAMRALSYDVPVLVMPSHPMMDQPMVGRALQEAGVGRLLAAGADPGAIGAAVTDMLADAALASRARGLGNDIRAEDGAVRAADLLEQVALRPGAGQKLG